MAGEIELLGLIEATHAIGHDIDGIAGRIALSTRPVRVTVQGQLRVDQTGRERFARTAPISLTPLPKEIA